MSNKKQSIKLYTEEEVLRVLNMVSKLYKPLTVNQTIEHLTPIELPNNNELKEISKHEILYNDSKRGWWVEGAKYVLNIIKIQGGDNEL